MQMHIHVCRVAGAAENYIRTSKKDSVIIWHNLIMMSSDFPADTFCFTVKIHQYLTFFRRFSFPCKCHLLIQPSVPER